MFARMDGKKDGASCTFASACIFINFLRLYSSFWMAAAILCCLMLCVFSARLAESDCETFAA